MAESVSSIYGPGAIICWLCTVLSVTLSWSLNRSCWEHDTITNDLVACLLLPGIALVHLLYELAAAKKIENWKATPTMDAALTICMIFAATGSTLCSLAGVRCHIRRTISALLLLVACIITFMTIALDDGSKFPRFDGVNADCSMIPAVCHIFGGIALLFWHCLERRRELWGIFWWCLLSTGVSMSMICGVVLTNDEAIIHGTFRVFPQTPYSLGDIYQAVAVAIGVLTLLLCLRDIVLDMRTSVDDKIEYVRVRCMEDIEMGNAKVVMRRWTLALAMLDRKSRCERARARHLKREREINLKLYPII